LQKKDQKTFAHARFEPDLSVTVDRFVSDAKERKFFGSFFKKERLVLLADFS